MDDSALKRDILEELDFEPGIHSSDIGIAIHGGVVTVSGHVPSLADKTKILGIIETVRGVRGIADEIEVRPVGTHVTADDEIAQRAADTLRWTTSIPDDRIHITVARGWVTLRGEVSWGYQARAAEKAMRRLIGVTGVSNQLRIVPAIDPEEVTGRIHKALRELAEEEAAAIRVSVDGSVVTLDGEVHDPAARHSAMRAAWAAPGVSLVIDRLRLS